MTRAAMQAGPEAAWPSDVVAHLAGCDDCAAIAVAVSLERAPVVAIPPTFAVDVARRARLDAAPERRRLSAGAAGVGVSAVVLAVALAWFSTVAGTGAVEPVAVAALLLACGEAIVLAAWTLDADVTRARWRQ